jgi:vancomycin resistance protein YoaR
LANQSDIDRSPLREKHPLDDERQLVRARRRRRGRRRLAVLLAVASLLFLVIVAAAIDAAVYAGKVHAGVSVAGVHLGGLTEDEATAALSRFVTEGQQTVVRVTSGGRSWEITPADVGVTVDVPGAVAAAMQKTRKSNFLFDVVRRFGLYLSHADIPFQGSYDDAKMTAALEKVARQIDIPAVSAGVAVVGEDVQVIQGQKGNVVDRDALRAALEPHLYAFRVAEVPAPMEVAEPAVLAADSTAAVQQAKVMISDPVKLTWGDRTWTLTAEDIAAYMDFSAKDQGGVSTLTAFVSAAKMSPLLTKISKLVEKKPVDASFKSDGLKAWVIPGTMGRALDAEATAQALTTAALKASGRNAKVAVKEVEPDLTAKEAEAMGIKVKLAGWKIEHWGVEERQQNVRVTTKYADKILAPGEIYNFDKQIGPRTEARGFMPAPGIVGEGNLEDVLGGGICQVATTLYNAVFEAGLEVIERHNHTLYFSHYPAGRDATVTADAKNFLFRNDTDHYIWVHGSSDGITTTFNIYGTKDGRKVKSTFSGWTTGDERTVETEVDPALGPGETVIERAGQSGRSCTVTRLVTMPDGTVLHQGPETYKSVYPMISRIILVSAADAGASTTTSGSAGTTGSTPTTTTTTTTP